MLDHKEILDMHDRAYERGQVTRERASDDLVFAWVTQWDDQLLGESQLQYRGEFNILRKAMRQIISDMKENQVQIDFEPTDDNYVASDLLDGIYRTTTRKNTSVEAFGNAIQEAVTCGTGAWRLENVPEGRYGEQVIKRTPIFEACNTVYWDPNSNLIDKSDAVYCSILQRYSDEGYKDFVEELTGERPDTTISFKYPEESYVFPWIAEDKRIYIGEFFHREKCLKKVHILSDIAGELYEVEDEKFQEQEKEFVEIGLEYVEEREVISHKVYRYLVTGQEVIEISEVPGTNIPIVPSYGERAMVEGEEHYEGITRLTKDPQRLRNFQMSYLADIVSRSPRRKPIFLKEQLDGYQFMFDENGSDNNYPYFIQNRVDESGNELPLGPVGEMPEQPLPQALIASIELSRQAVEDVANPGLPQDIADPDISGKAVMALQGRMDMQSAIYQDNHKHALRRDAEIFAAMAPDVYDTPRKITMTKHDGTRMTKQMMKPVFDTERMEVVMTNDLTGVEFEVYAEIGPNYKTQRDETRSELKELMITMPPEDPVRNILLLEYLAMTPGSDFENLRTYANHELMRQGIKEPESEDDMMFMQQVAQQQQQQQPDPQTLAAMAEMEKAGAEQMNAQVRMFDAQTKRAKVEVDATKAGVEIDALKEDVRAKRFSNMKNLADQLRPPPLQPPKARTESRVGL